MLDTHRFPFLLLCDDLDGERKGRKGSQGGSRGSGSRSGGCCFIQRSCRGAQLGRRSRTICGRVNPYKCILKSSPTCHKKTSSVLFFDISFIHHLSIGTHRARLSPSIRNAYCYAASYTVNNTQPTLSFDLFVNSHLISKNHVQSRQAALGNTAKTATPRAVVNTFQRITSTRPLESLGHDGRSSRYKQEEMLESHRACGVISHTTLVLTSELEIAFDLTKLY